MKKIFSSIKKIFLFALIVKKKLFLKDQIIFINPRHKIYKKKISLGAMFLFLFLFLSLILINFTFLSHKNLTKKINQVKKENAAEKKIINEYKEKFSTLKNQQEIFKKEFLFVNNLISTENSTPFNIKSQTFCNRKISKDQNLINLKENLNQSYLELVCNIKSIEMLEEYQYLKKNFITQIPNGWPLKNNIGYKTSGYGLRPSITDSSEVEFHYGVDIASYPKTEIIATADGVVIFSGVKKGYGNIVILKHNYNFKTAYAHNEENLVEVNQVVKKNDTIALLGNTGRSTGYHLHYEILVDNKLVDPWPYIISYF